MANDCPYRMSISLNVLDHLGIGLYSNTPAVLSEIVANSWDADATSVTIDIDRSRDRIVITDDGIGMTTEDINQKYLMVGYRKRDNEPPRTARGRTPMGRKGIGKLSVFSIADTVEVHSVKAGEVNGFIMSAASIRRLIEAGGEVYMPTPVEEDRVEISRGTCLILRDFKKRLTQTEEYLRMRLARRFSIIGTENEFEVWINGQPISSKDRNFYANMEFLWFLGDESEPVVAKCPNLRRAMRVDNVVDLENGYTVRGWIGTVDEQRNIDEQHNTIVVFAHGKLIQEDILQSLKEGGIYSKYLIGEIDADFMDLDHLPDVVTSDRQSIKEDDPRYEALRMYVHGVLKQIQRQWTDLRNEVGTQRALEQPAVKAWFDRLSGDNKRYAQQLFGKIESLRVVDREAKKELYKHTLLAFERLALKNALSILESLETEKDFELVARLFEGIDEIEAVHYYQIVKGRLQVVREFERVLPTAREKLLQQHIFDHLWLLDPSWERASSNFRIEESVTKEFDRINANLTPEEQSGRVDIRYRTAAGKHIIIELKKYDRKVTAFELAEQIGKYRSAMLKCLRTQFGVHEPNMEAICIVGPIPEPQDQPVVVQRLLDAVDARYITYDTLIQQTLESYEEYLAKEKEVSELVGLIEDLDRTFV